MSRYVIDGRFWYAGDNVYIETEERGMNGLPTEVCLNDFLKEHIKENREVSIIIDVDKNEELVDKIASFFEEERNWKALKNCWLENDKSDDLRTLLHKALKG